jgi:N-acetylneuraminic acid mutarotase
MSSRAPIRSIRRNSWVLVAFAAGCGGSDDQTAASAGAPQWRSLTPASLERTEVAAARVGRYVYVMGGFESETRRTTAATERYDIVRNRWRRVADMPVGLNHAAAVAYRGDVYVLGGYREENGGQREVATLYRYDPDRDRWTRLPSAPSARGALTAGVIRNRLYAAGGANSQHGAVATLEIFDFRTRRWRSGPDMGLAREHLAGAVARGRFYVLAGRAMGGFNNFAVAEAFNPRTGRWRDLPPMTKPRGGTAATTVSGRIVVLGGEEDAGTIREVELFNPRTRRWRRLPDMRTPRHGLGAVSRRGRVYAIAGGDEPFLTFTPLLEALRIR